MKSKLVLVRHGQSEWNKRNLFTGWVDVPLSPEGIDEALKAGERIKHIPFDEIFVSTLSRAQLTAYLAMSVHDEGKVPRVIHTKGKQEEWSHVYNPKSEEDTIPVHVAWELNERYYGELQGLNKQETREKFGDEQVKIWRRSFDTPPPNGESLKMCAARTIPYFQKEVVPLLEEGSNILISAHGNSLRSIVMHLDNLSEKEVLELELPTGEPLLYSMVDGKWHKEGL